MDEHIFEWVAAFSPLIVALFNPIFAIIYGIGVFVGIIWGLVMKERTNEKIDNKENTLEEG